MAKSCPPVLGPRVVSPPLLWLVTSFIPPRVPCQDVTPGQARVFRCLAENMNDADFGNQCKYQIIYKLQRRCVRVRVLARQPTCACARGACPPASLPAHVCAWTGTCVCTWMS